MSEGRRILGLSAVAIALLLAITPPDSPPLSEVVSARFPGWGIQQLSATWEKVQRFTLECDGYTFGMSALRDRDGRINIGSKDKQMLARTRNEVTPFFSYWTPTMAPVVIPCRPQEGSSAFR